jgi:hypothetical protein
MNKSHRKVGMSTAFELKSRWENSGCLGCGEYLDIMPRMGGWGELGGSWNRGRGGLCFITRKSGICIWSLVRSQKASMPLSLRWPFISGIMLIVFFLIVGRIVHVHLRKLGTIETHKQKFQCWQCGSSGRVLS